MTHEATPREYVFVPLADFHYGVSLEEQADRLEYVYSVGEDNWTSDPYNHRHAYDNEDADYLRVERGWAEANLTAVNSSDGD